MCYVHNQCYGISCATLYLFTGLEMMESKKFNLLRRFAAILLMFFLNVILYIYTHT